MTVTGVIASRATQSRNPGSVQALLDCRGASRLATTEYFRFIGAAAF